MSCGHLCVAEAPTEAAAETYPSRRFMQNKTGGGTPPLHPSIYIDETPRGLTSGVIFV